MGQRQEQEPYLYLTTGGEDSRLEEWEPWDTQDSLENMAGEDLGDVLDLCLYS